MVMSPFVTHGYSFRSETLGSLRCGAWLRHKHFLQTECVAEQKQQTHLQCIGSKTGCGALVGARCELATACHWKLWRVSRARCCCSREIALRWTPPKGGPLPPKLPAGSAFVKLKILLRPEIEHARCIGGLCFVPQLICDMGRVWNTDVRETEGCNNTIEHISK